MAFWRMHLHPDQPGQAVHHTVVSLSAGYIGLDFSEDVSDLMVLSQSDLPEHQRNYWGFAREMREGDRVLLFTHHYPFALVRVAGPYNKNTVYRSRKSEYGFAISGRFTTSATAATLQRTPEPGNRSP